MTRLLEKLLARSFADGVETSSRRLLEIAKQVESEARQSDVPDSVISAIVGSLRIAAGQLENDAMTVRHRITKGEEVAQ